MIEMSGRGKNILHVERARSERLLEQLRIDFDCCCLLLVLMNERLIAITKQNDIFGKKPSPSLIDCIIFFVVIGRSRG